MAALGALIAGPFVGLIGVIVTGAAAVLITALSPLREATPMKDAKR
jgi:hypothetical protein